MLDFYKEQGNTARRLARLRLSTAHRIAFIRLALHWRRLAQAQDITSPDSFNGETFSMTHWRGQFPKKACEDYRAASDRASRSPDTAS
jgi:hypothetical protein